MVGAICCLCNGCVCLSHLYWLRAMFVNMSMPAKVFDHIVTFCECLDLTWTDPACTFVWMSLHLHNYQVNLGIVGHLID